MLAANPSLTPAQVLSILQSTARSFPSGGSVCAPSPPDPNPANWFACHCTTALCGAGILDAYAAVFASFLPSPGTGTVVSNPYGALSVQGATLSGNTISNLQQNVVIQLGTVAGSQGSYIEIDFQGLNLGPGRTLTVRSGATGQGVAIYNTGTGSSSIAGSIQALGSNGAPPPWLLINNPFGMTIQPSGSIIAPNGLTLNTLGSTWYSGQPLINQGRFSSIQALPPGSALQLVSMGRRLSSPT